MTNSEDLNLSELNLYGRHVLAKKGDVSIAYTDRKKGKITISCRLQKVTV